MERKKTVGVVTPISNKTDFKTMTVARGKEGYYIITKGTIQQKDISLVNFMHST